MTTTCGDPLDEENVACVLRAPHKVHTDGKRFTWSPSRFGGIVIGENCVPAAELAGRGVDPGSDHAEVLLMNDDVASGGADLGV